MDGIFTADNIKFLLDGLYLTLYISIITIIISLIFGTIIGVLRYSSKGIIKVIVSIYVEFLRNTPLLLWILAIYFMVPSEVATSVNKGIIAMSVFTSAIVSEIVRAGLNSIPTGQYEAAASQGFNKVQTLIYIILPQVFKNMIPALVSQFITVIKDTSFLAVVQIEELTGKGQIIMGKFSDSSKVFILFGTLAAIYFVINFILSSVFRFKQTKLS